MAGPSDPGLPARQTVRPPGRAGLADLLMSASVRNLLYQVLACLLVIAVGWYLIDNTLTNLARQNIATGFGYMEREAAFGISESMIPYSPTDSYGRALVVGILNTVKVALLGIVLATILGLVVGIAQLSPNWLLARLAAMYVGLFRNLPVLLQLVFWAAIIRSSLPSPRQAEPFGPGLYLTNRGLYMPWPDWPGAWNAILAGLLLGLLAAFLIHRWARRRQAATGAVFPAGWAGLLAAALLVLGGWLAGGAPLAFDTPALQGFNLQGGARMTPEFVAVLLGLTVYTSAFIAEVVRAGVKAVPRGQWEAANSLGLRRGQVMRLVVLPQAMRVIIPPLTNQYLNLTKNSSLAVAVGYPDLVSISNTTLNQTGQAIEAIAVFMAIYLGLSLLTSAFMNWFNARMALVER